MLGGDSLRRQRWLWWALLFVVAVFAFGFRYYYILHAVVQQPRGDAIGYVAYARNLVQHGVFTMTAQGAAPLAGDSFRDPGYPVFLAFWMRIFNDWNTWYAAVLLSQVVLSSLTVVAVLSLARRWMSMGWLAAAGVLMAVWPHSVSMSGYMLSETLFGFLCAIGLLCLGVALQRRSILWAAASGIGLSLAALTNAVMLPFAVVVGLFLLMRRQLSLAMFAGLVLAALATIAPWSIRNAMLPTSGPTSTDRALLNLVQGSWPGMHAAYQAKVNKDANAGALMAPINEEAALVEADPITGLSAMGRRMSSHPAIYIRWYLGKPRLLWDWNIRVGQGDIYVFPTHNSPFEANTAFRLVAALCRALNFWLFVLAIAGCLLALIPKQEKTSGVAATALMLIFVTLVYSTLQAEPRYSVAFRALEIALATFASYRISQWIGHRRNLSKNEPSLT